MHLECACQDKQKAQRELAKLHGMGCSDFTLGIRMQLIDQYKDVKGNMTNIKKLEDLRGKQMHFCQKLGNGWSSDILNLDFVYSKLRMSLRETIMSIKIWDINPSNLFHTINES